MQGFGAGSSLEQVLILPWMRTEFELTELAGNLLTREHPAYRQLGPSHATVHSQASDQSDREPRLSHGFGLDRLWNMFDLALHANRGRNDRTGREYIDP